MKLRICHAGKLVFRVAIWRDQMSVKSPINYIFVYKLKKNRFLSRSLCGVMFYATAALFLLSCERAKVDYVCKG